MGSLNVLFIDEHGNNESKKLEFIPRLGDVVPIFHSRGEVTKVVWFPHLIDNRFTQYSVLITLS